MLLKLTLAIGSVFSVPLSGDLAPTSLPETNIFVDVSSPEDGALRRAASELIAKIEKLWKIQVQHFNVLHKTLSFAEGDADSASVAELVNRAVESSRGQAASLDDMWTELAKENQVTLGPLYHDAAIAKLSGATSA